MDRGTSTWIRHMGSFVGRGGMLLAVAIAISGCAGQHRQALSRLQSQVGLLDERVAQLERTSAPSFSQGGWASPAQEGLPAGQAGAGTAAKATAPSPQPATEAVPPTPKPSTREIQRALKNAGFYQGATDGKRGPMTKAAVREFQRVHGLKDDGVVGKQTWAKLSAYADLSSGSDAGELNAAEPWK